MGRFGSKAAVLVGLDTGVVDVVVVVLLVVEVVVTEMEEEEEEAGAEQELNATFETLA